MSEEEQQEETIIDKIEKFVTTIIGLRSTTELTQLLTKLTHIKGIIESAYQIGDFIEKYDEYKKRKITSTVLQGITDTLMPQFQQFLAEKFEEQIPKLAEPVSEENLKPKKTK